jgi:hypothetical protein
VFHDGALPQNCAVRSRLRSSDELE